MTLRRHAIPFATLVVATLVAQPVPAQSMKPGLWQLTTNIDVGKQRGQMQQFSEALKRSKAAMSPAERKIMEDDMASRHQKVSGNAISLEFCLAPEMAARRQVLPRQFDSCNVKQSPMVGSTVHFSYSCNDARSSGEGSVTFSGATGFTQEVRSVSRDHHGPAIASMTMASTGRWLGSDCGSIKPQRPDQK